jgi:hypothetical protein
MGSSAAWRNRECSSSSDRTVGLNLLLKCTEESRNTELTLGGSWLWEPEKPVLLP